EEKNKNYLDILKWDKRVDHRHHAIDALIVACTEPIHIKRLNNLNKELQDWLVKNKEKIMPNFEGTSDELLDAVLNIEKNKREKILLQIEGYRKIEKPWQGFPDEAKKQIENIIISHKPKDKLLIQKNKENKLSVKIRGELHEST